MATHNAFLHFLRLRDFSSSLIISPSGLGRPDEKDEEDKDETEVDEGDSCGDA